MQDIDASDGEKETATDKEASKPWLIIILCGIIIAIGLGGFYVLEQPGDSLGFRLHKNSPDRFNLPRLCNVTTDPSPFRIY